MPIPFLEPKNWPHGEAPTFLAADPIEDETSNKQVSSQLEDHEEQRRVRYVLKCILIYNVL